MKKLIIIGISLILFTAWNIPPQKDIGICHKCGQEWVYRLIKEGALEGHLKHGDFLYKGRPDVYPQEMDDWCMKNLPWIPNHYRP